MVQDHIRRVKSELDNNIKRLACCNEVSEALEIRKMIERQQNTLKKLRSLDSVAL
jgi:hypothetical protein